MKTIWVIGGPGCGKGTQCDLMIKKYGFLHLSSGDLLRAEVASGSERGASLQNLMSKGLFVPTDIVLELIKEQMDKVREEGTTKTGFLIDGYPREKDQGILFEEKVCPVDLILFFDVANDTLNKRLLGRAAMSQREDDNQETIKKRIEIFNKKNNEIVEYYKDKIIRINAEGTVDEIFAEITKALDTLFLADLIQCCQ
ncbi:KAD1 kinase, partial [Pseudoatta argentina]